MSSFVSSGRQHCRNTTLRRIASIKGLAPPSDGAQYQKALASKHEASLQPIPAFPVPSFISTVTGRLGKMLSAATSISCEITWNPTPLDLLTFTNHSLSSLPLFVKKRKHTCSSACCNEVYRCMRYDPVLLKTQTFFRVAYFRNNHAGKIHWCDECGMLYVKMSVKMS